LRAFILHPSAFILALERDADRLEDFVKHGFGFFAAPHGRRVTRTDGDPMGKDGNYQALNVVRQAIGSFFGERESLRCPE
jgi:hypothetical protein